MIFQTENGIPEKSQEETPKADGDKQDNKVLNAFSSSFFVHGMNTIVARVFH